MPSTHVPTSTTLFFQGVLLHNPPKCVSGFSPFHHPERMRMFSVNILHGRATLCMAKQMTGRCFSKTSSHWQGRPFSLDQILPVANAPCPSSRTSSNKHLVESRVTHSLVSLSQVASWEIVASDVARQQADLALPSNAVSFVPPGHISVTSSVGADKPAHLFTSCEWAEQSLTKG